MGISQPEHFLKLYCYLILIKHLYLTKVGWWGGGGGGVGGGRDSDSITVQHSGLTHDFWIGDSLYIYGGGGGVIFILYLCNLYLLIFRNENDIIWSQRGIGIRYF